MENGILQNVFYDLFDFEADTLDGPESHFSHTIDRELCLELVDGRKIFISWWDVPVQYSVGMGEISFFKPEEYVRVDACSHPMWKGIIGQPVEFLVLDDGHQIVELRSPVGSIYFSTSQDGQFGYDALTVSTTMPRNNFDILEQI
jgi:hypothetical protein